MPLANKKVLLPLAALAFVGALGYGVAQASADSTGTATDPQASLVQKLSDKFGIDKTKVQAVFDENRSEQMAKHEAAYGDRLAQAVKDGKLTDAQKSAVLAEHNKLAAELKDAMSKTGADRRSAMEAVMQEGKTWASQNSLDPQWLMMGGHGPGHRDMMGQGSKGAPSGS